MAVGSDRRSCARTSGYTSTPSRIPPHTCRDVRVLRTTWEKGGDRRSTGGANGGKDAAEICAAHCLQILIVDRSSSSAVSPSDSLSPVKLESVFIPCSARDLLTPSLFSVVLKYRWVKREREAESKKEMRDKLGKRDRTSSCRM